MGQRFYRQCEGGGGVGNARASSRQRQAVQRRQRRACDGAALAGNAAGRDRRVRARLLHRLSEPQARICREVHAIHRLDRGKSTVSGIGKGLNLTAWGADMKWITRERVRVDRVACPWLIKKSVDPKAEFLFVPADQVMAVANQEGAVPYDVPN